MKKKGIILFSSLILSGLLVACGSDESEEAAADQVEEENVESEEEEVEEVDEESEEEVGEEEQVSADSDFNELISYMEEKTEGTTKVLYENNQAQSHEMEGLTVTFDSYVLLELSDFHTNYNIPFDDETDGNVILAQVTVKNDSDTDLHYMPTLDMDYVGGNKYLSNYRELLPEEQQLPVILSPSNDYTVKAGEEVTGYLAYPIGKTRFEDVSANGSVDVQIPAPLTDMEDFSSSVGSKGRLTLPLGDESAAKQEEVDAQGFYEDRVTATNMGEKTMIESKEGIGESQEVNNSTITLEGYQFTEFEPNADEAPRFENFTEGIVLLTVKFLIDNGEEADISKSTTTATLYLNDGKQWMINEGMLLNYTTDTIPAGEEGELLQIYALDKEQYDKIWKDKSFEIKIGPSHGADGAGDISKGHDATFQLK